MTENHKSSIEISGIKAGPDRPIGQSFMQALRDTRDLVKGMDFDECDEVGCDISGAQAYAEERGVTISDLSLEERKKFVNIERMEGVE